MAVRPESHGLGASLWLVPDEPVRASLAATIEDLARRLGTTPFPPHVTLLSGMRAREGDVVRRAGEMCRALEPMRLRASKVEASASFFRCLALRVEETLGLLTAHAQAGMTFAPPDAPYEPHLSLVYGALDDAARAALVPELRQGLPVAFGVNSLEVWRTSGPVGDWKRLAGWSFGPAAS